MSEKRDESPEMSDPAGDASPGASEPKHRRLREPKVGRRTCGPCTACCHSMQINELDKPEWAPCERQRAAGLSGGGCGDYENRPASCQSFACLWLSGLSLTGTQHRPDRCGVMLVPTEDPRTVQARELWAGAAAVGSGRELLVSLRRAGVRVVLVDEVRRRVLCALTINRRAPSLAA